MAQLDIESKRQAICDAIIDLSDQQVKQMYCILLNPSGLLALTDRKKEEMKFLELIERLKVVKTRDPEADHTNADKLLIAFIESSAPKKLKGKVRKLWDKLEKWYA